MDPALVQGGLFFFGKYICILILLSFYFGCKSGCMSIRFVPMMDEKLSRGCIITDGIYDSWDTGIVDRLYYGSRGQQRVGVCNEIVKERNGVEIPQVGV